MLFKPLAAGEHRYGVAVREESDLLLTLWVRRVPEDDVYVMMPVGHRKWNPHTSYHLDGSRHSKSFGQSPWLRRKLQPLTDAFKGTENVGCFGADSPKSVGQLCDPADFSAVVEVPEGILGPSKGSVVVDLVEPGCISKVRSSVSSMQLSSSSLGAGWLAPTPRAFSPISAAKRGALGCEHRIDGRRPPTRSRKAVGSSNPSATARS